MKLYLWMNKRCTSQLWNPTENEQNIRADHSACIVILAKNMEEAIKEAEQTGEPLHGNPREIEIEGDGNARGLVVFASGEC